MSSIFEKQTSSFLNNNFKNQSKASILLDKSIEDANSIYNNLLEKYENLKISDSDIIEINNQINKLEKQKNSANNILNLTTRQVENLNNLIKTLSGIVTIMNTIIQIITSLPIPSQFSTIGIIVTFSYKIQQAGNKINLISSAISSTQPFLNILNNEITQTKVKIDILDNIIALIKAFLSDRNSEYNKDNQNNNIIDKQKQINNITGNNNIIGSYKEYTFILKQEENQKFQIGSIKRNYAVAINNKGIEILKSDFSFASEPQILIDQLKYEIDNLII